MKGLCVLFVVFLLSQVHYSEATCTPDGIYSSSGVLACTQDSGAIIDSTWILTNPSGGPILISIVLDDAGYFSPTNTFELFEPSSGLTIYIADFEIYYYDFTYTSYSNSVYVTLSGIDTAAMSLTYTMLDNPCVTSMNIVWTVPNPSFDISCNGAPTAPVHSTWSIVNYGTMKYEINSGDSSKLGFYDGSSKSAQQLYPTTSQPHGYSTGSQLFVTYDNTGNSSVDVTISYIDLCYVGSTEPSYWLDHGSFSCNGMNQVTAMINVYGKVSTPSIVPPISEGQIALINIDITNQGNYQTQFRVYTGNYNYDTSSDNNTFAISFSERDYLTIQIFNFAFNPSVAFKISWQILPQSSNPCLSSTSLTIPQSTGVIGCRSDTYDVISSIPPHTGSWLLQTPPGTRIYLNIILDDLGDDTMILYDGPTTSSPILETVDVNGATEISLYSNYASGNSVLVVYKHSSLTASVRWYITYEADFTVDLCQVSGQIYRTAETGRIACTSVAPNLSSRWEIGPNNGPISISFDSVNLLSGETITIYDPTVDSTLGSIDSTFNKTGEYIDTGSVYLWFTLSTPASGGKRATPGSFQLSYSTVGDVCEIDSSLYFETTAGYFTCTHIAPSVTSTITIAPHNGIVDFYYEFDLSSGGFVVITDLEGNLIENSNSAADFVSRNYGIIIHFQSGAVDSYTSGDYFYFTYTTQGSLCGSSSTDVLTTAEGIFGCPEGTNNDVDSYWLITPENGVIVMKFATIDLEAGFDYVEIWDGSDTTGKYLGAFSSIPTNNSIIAYSGAAYVHLHTDALTTSNGFEMAYTSGVGDACLSSFDIQLSDPYGSFGCPNGVAANVNSYWYITVPQSDGVVEARFTEFSLSLTALLCVLDPNTRDTCYDANNIPDVIVGTTNQLLFVIHTQQPEPGGFYVEYTTVQNDPCKLDRNVTLSANSNSFGCVTGISKNVASGWLIAPDDLNVITLTFSEFKLDSDSHIYVYNGNTTSPSTLLGNFTGSTLPNVVVSTGPYMFVYLVAGAEDATQRFRATYTTNNGDPCSSSLEQTILTSSGTFGCQHGVLPSVHSSWLVVPQSNNIIELTIQWATLCSQCRLTIYDGSSTSADVLFRSNQTSNTVVYTTHSAALITVDTIPNSNSNGFLIYFVTAIPPTPSPNVILPSATASPIPEGFSRSASPGPISATQSPFSQTPVFRTRTASVSRTNFPQASQQVSTRTATPEPASESPTASMSTTPEPVFPSTTATHSRAPQFTIVPFSPSNFPTSVATVIPSRRVRDRYTLDIEFTCKTSAATCCNNFQTLWVDLSTTNYYDLVDVNSCVETSSGNIEVSLDQYGSQFFSAEQILDDYWKIGSCNGKPLTGDICNVSGRGLSTTLWDISSMVVEGIAGIPSPLPYYYYEEVIYIGGSSIVTISLGLFAFVLVIFA